MSVGHLEQAAELDIHATTKLVLMALCDDASKGTRLTYPGMEKLRVWGGVKERRALQIIDTLITDGLLARTAFAYPGRRASFIVFPTPDEYEQLDAKDPRLNVGHPTREQIEALAAGEVEPVDNGDEAAAEPVDNSLEMGAAHCGSPNNGCNLTSNGCNPDCTPPVSTPVGTISGPVPEVSTDAVVVASGTGLSITPKTISATAGHPLHHPTVFAAIGEYLPDTFDDAKLDILAAEITARAASPVIDPTGYVIRVLRNRDGRIEWQARAFDIDVRHDRTRPDGRDF